MSLKSTLVELEDSACAKTNIIDIQGNIEDNIKRLLTSDIDGLFITHCIRKFRKEKNEQSLDFEKRMHREIKVVIRKDLSLPSTNLPKYELVNFWNNGQRTVYFFYLSCTKTEPEELLRSIHTESIDKHKVFQALVSLHLKLLFVSQTKDEYELDPVYFNSELYLAAELQRQPTLQGIAKLDTLYPKLYFSQFNELITTIHKKSFLTKACNSDEVRADIDETQLLFRNKTSAYRTSNEINAIQFSKKLFITFHEGYRQCINHAQNLVLGILKHILTSAGISFTERLFKADFALDDFIIAKKSIHKPMIIIDNLNKNLPKDQRRKLYEQLHEKLKPQAITTCSKYPHFNDLSNEYSYLILNQSLARNGSSVAINGKIKNTFWDAYNHFQKEGTEGLDYYSKLKIARFESDTPVILQGLNIDKLTKNKTDKNTGEISTVFKPISEYALERIKTELWLKEKVFFDKSIGEVNLPDCQLILVYIRKPGGRWSKKIYASVVHVSVIYEKLVIKSQEVYNSESKLRFYCSFLRSRKNLYNDSFYIFDEINEVFLSTYNSSRIPLIIGNQQVDSLAVAANNNDKVRRVSGVKETVLPYYLIPKERKQYHHIYLQQREHDLLYFVSTINRPKPKIEKQNLIYNILTFDKNGNIINALDQEVTEIYLKSFTEDILRLGEVSKSSLLEKVAKVFIEN